MKRFSQQFHKSASGVRLKAEEKRELRERVVAYMEYHPLPDAPRAAATPLHTEPFATVAMPFGLLWRGVAGFFVLFLVFVPVLAERSVPGDTLYAVKVQFNEELRSTLTFDSYQKVEWETQRLNRRLAEARLLASEGRLTQAMEVQVAEAVRAHSENLQREIDELRTVDIDDAAIASIELGTTLAVQSESLRQAQEREDVATTAAAEANATSAPTTTRVATTEADSATNLIASAIDELRAANEASRSTSTPPAYDKLMAKVEQNTTRIYELRDSVQDVAPETAYAEVQRRIEDLERAIAAAIEQRNQDELAARQRLVDLLERTQKLIVYMTVIEVVVTVDIDRLVPIELMPEEEAAISANLLSEIKQRQTRIAELLPQVTDPGVVEKAEYAETLMDENLAALASTSWFAAFEPLAKDTLEIGSDTVAALERSLAPNSVTSDKDPNADPSRDRESATNTPATSTPAESATNTPATSTPAESATTTATDQEESVTNPATSSTPVEDGGGDAATNSPATASPATVDSGA
ncbi:MAG: DUF5667 domain-containing protein [Patescibacteria group bacterium]